MIAENGPQAQAQALVEGFNTASLAAAILIAVGALLMLVLVRRSDAANIDPEAAPLPSA